MPDWPRDFADFVLRAWRGSLDVSGLIDYATELEHSQRAALTVVLYRTWLERNTSPYAYAVYFNLGVALAKENDLKAAEAAYQQSFALNPGFAQPRLNLGSLYERMGRVDEALREWQWVAENLPAQPPHNKPLLLMALNHLGRVLETHKRLAESLQWLCTSLSVEPEQPDVLQHWVHLRQKQCIWPVLEPLSGVGVEAMREAASTLSMLCITDDLMQQRDAARRYAKQQMANHPPPMASPRGYGHQTLRIAYLSSDFCLHPVAMLCAELFELHDRSRFEVYAFCWSPQDDSPLRARVMQGMDQFIRIDTQSDDDAAKLIRSHDIDILVDLQGQTSGARPGVLAQRPAPIQITWLGLPATTAMPCIDYLIADRFVVPETTASLYTEKILYLPDVYQVSDRKRAVGRIPSRGDCGLPEQGFVYCCFNNNFKFTPEVFDAWMRILHRTPGSVLWLLSDNPWAEANLGARARQLGMDANRLVFAPRVAPPDYLARYAVADLFLDTFPFNAGATANDALWMELPVLTIAGQSFASRMAGALLTAAQMPELIAYNLRDYEERAVALAVAPQECTAFRARLKSVKSTGVLFDTPRFVRQLETRLQEIAADLAR